MDDNIKKRYDAINNIILFKAYEINRDIYQRYYNHRKDNNNNTLQFIFYS